MLFNSYIYILLFLPIALLGYYWLAKFSDSVSKTWLVLASLFFYAYWVPTYLFLIIGSMLGNYTLATNMLKARSHPTLTPKTILILGIIFNFGLLGYYKYADFFIANINLISGFRLPLLRLLLPLAISFFTFQQIAYLMDVYQGKTQSYGLLNYALFVTFFPQLIAGPIVHHREMMPQFSNTKSRTFNPQNFSNGIFLFSLGLFKKVIIADTFAIWANAGFEQTTPLTFFPAWATSLSYTFQIYFDFSGYTDMALGSAKLFNIHLPPNFNTPYCADNIQEFWRRWHMTLSRWLRDYLYIPLGGNRKGSGRTYINLMTTFLLGGLWHGAGWTFVIWGLLHGAGTSIHKYWSSRHFRLPTFIGWVGTFFFINLTWVFFRATSLEQATNILRSMAGFQGIVFPKQLRPFLTQFDLTYGKLFAGIGNAYEILLVTIIFGAFSICGKNSLELLDQYAPNKKWTLATTCILLYALNNLDKVSEFLYFNF
ncbi:MAG: MBOAT family protein [Candidatus Latescibacteria bacterium]|jgi:alginate O-acetyltransferase complex protein AlgI|nr:MBOAT family protein [Candidatus Latescibacterota bacterium]MBT4138321.1 MBOAT family protein [Candidatus Latescibacterota bacterium]MBT5828642.1 MBOAT family protein [Candidatus Latescibacterota bacterium]